MKIYNASNIKSIEFDALIIGGGGSGMRASLELAKNGYIDVKQDKMFGNIYIKSRK